jgi:hypothetical protein
MKDMSDIKKKLQEIKMARMGPEYRFVAEMFSDLEIRYSVKKPGCTFYLLNGEPLFLHMKDGNYFWCHYEKFWKPLQKMVYEKTIENNTPSLLSIINNITISKMREIINHFLFAYFDILDATSSMASSEVTNSWRKTKLIKRKPWK